MGTNGKRLNIVTYVLVFVGLFRWHRNLLNYETSE